jgi:hypothetical protein
VLTKNSDDGVLFSNMLFLLGFSLIVLLTLINGLHFLYPAVPNLRLRTNIGHLFTANPWNAIGWTPIAIYPWIVGIAFFIPLDLSLSVWFFYLFTKFQKIGASTFGLHSLPSFPYLLVNTL